MNVNENTVVLITDEKGRVTAVAHPKHINVYVLGDESESADWTDQPKVKQEWVFRSLDPPR